MTHFAQSTLLELLQLPQLPQLPQYLAPARLGSLVPLLLQLALGATILIALAAIGCRFARCAATRHVLWSATVASLLALPILALLLPALTRVQLPIATLQGSPAAAITRATDRDTLPATATTLPAAPTPAQAQAQTQAHTPAPAPAQTQAQTRAGAASTATALSTVLSAVASPTALAGLWLLGTAALSLALLGGLVRRRRLLRSSHPFHHRGLGRCLPSDLPRSRQPRLRVTDAVEIPLTWGFFRPVVLLPLGAAEWSTDRLRPVLLHELAHVRRGDATWNAVARLVRALYWPLPLVWWAEARLVAESELACDDRVVRAGVQPSRYAQDLVGFARELRGSLPEPVAAMARRSGLARRVRAILDERRDRSTPGWPTVVAIVALLGVVVTPLVASVRIAAAGSQSVAELAEQELASALHASTPGVASHAGASAGPIGASPRSAPAAGSVRASLSLTNDEEDTEILPGCGPLRSTRIQRHDNRHQFELRADDCRFEIELDGELVIAGDERSIERVERGARLDYWEEVAGTERRLLVDADRGGAPRYAYSVGGDPRDFDATAQAWLAERLPFLLRVTGWQAEERVGRILARSGVDGLFDEIRRIPTDHVGRLYLTLTLEQAGLDTGELRRWIELAGTVLGSDFELAETLSLLDAATLDESSIQTAFVQAAQTIGSDFELRRTLAALLERGDLGGDVLDTVLEAARTIGSDFEVAELLVTLLARYPAGRAFPDTFFEIAATVDSDFELRRALGAFLERDDLARDDADRWGDQLDEVLAAAANIGSDFEAVELLTATARRYPAGRPLPRVYFDVAKTVGSDFELRRALQAALDRDLADEGLEQLLTLALSIGSDHELADLLLEVRRRHPLEGAVRDAFDEAVATLSGDARRRVEGSTR